MNKGINDPGVREAKGGVVIQQKRRSEQLESISQSFGEFLDEMDREFGNKLDTEIHKLRGYCEQLRIIADELKRAGK